MNAEITFNERMSWAQTVKAVEALIEAGLEVKYITYMTLEVRK